MPLIEFLRRVLPPTGVYNCFTTGDRRNRWAHSLEELAETIEALGERTDIYYAVASFLSEGTPYKGRTQDNVDQLKCFRLDLDAGAKKLETQGPEKVYATQRDALAALIGFSKETALAPSLIVSSGEGLHVYYELDEPVIPEQWQPLAKAFNKFGVAHGLKIDSSVTADHARVLRPIGTLHPNGKTVALLKDTGKVYTLAEFAEAVGAGAEPEAPQYDLSINDDLIVKGPPKSFLNVVKHCAAMQHVVRDQASIEEPLWRLGIGIAKHTVEGFEAAVAMSRKHPSYDEDELREKFDRWATGPSTCERFGEHTAKQCAGCKYRGQITSPIQLGDMSDRQVEALPEDLKPKDEPAAPPAPTGKPWDGCLPDKFAVKLVRGVETLVALIPVETLNADGEKTTVEREIPVTHDVFWFGHWADADNTDDTAQVTVHKMDRHLKRGFLMDQTVLASRSDFLKFLAGKGIHLTTHPKAAQAVEAYAKAQLQRIKSSLQRPKITDRFGLRILEDGSLVAAQGKFIIHGNGVIEEAMLAKSLRGEAEHYSVPVPPTEDSRWDPSVWKEHILPAARRHVDFMRRYYGIEGFEKYQLAIMGALASPLMAFVTDGYWRGSTLPGNGLSMAMFSENGGKGKTTVMRCAQLAFGSPAGLNKDNDDLNTTALARLARFSIAGTMPVNMDEMGDMDPKSLATLVRTIANGSGRARATKDGGLSVSAPWSLVCLIGTNKSQREIINQVRQTSSAEQFRLLELDVEHVPQFGVESQVAFERDWKTMGRNAGALGAVIHLLICRMGVEAVNKLVSERVAEAARMVQGIKVESASRFQYRGLGAILALFDLLERVGLAPFNRDGVVNEFLAAYQTAVTFVEENVVPSDGLEILARALQDLQPKTIITQEYSARRGKPGANAKVDMDIRGRVPNEVAARHVLSTRITYLSSSAFRNWCVQNGVRESVVLGAARYAEVLQRPYPSLGRGTEEGKPHNKRWVGPFNLFGGMRENPGGSVNCYVINVGKLGSLLGVDLQDSMAHPAQVVELRPAEEAGQAA